MLKFSIKVPWLHQFWDFVEFNDDFFEGAASAKQGPLEIFDLFVVAKIHITT